MSKKKLKDNRFFFNHKGIVGHASLKGEPDKELMDALFKMVEIAHKTVGKDKNKNNSSPQGTK